MPAHRPRPHLAAVLAASLVSLFVVVLGAAPSQAAATRVGTVATSGTPTQAGPVEVSTSPDVDVVALDLAGVAPVLPLDAPAVSPDHVDAHADDAAGTGVDAPSVRGPPAP